MSNMLDGELQSRAELLHANAGALSRQERDVERATAGLRRDNDKLARLVRDTEPRLKEIGNVQNWAEVLERDFLVLEETMRLVRRGSSDGETCSQCSSRSSTWSGSYSDDGSRSGSRVGSRRGSMNGDAKKDSPEQGVNGKTTTNGAVGDDMRKERNDTKVTVDEAVAASISEAMATNLHDALEPLTLDARPVPVSVPSSTQSAASKGKEPATEEMSDVDTTSAGASQPHSAAWSDTAEEQTTIGEDSKSASTAG
ncbi:hypothetical protein GGR52DRAFT_523663 [Hypoxylon sp. FL1284]|nr:hypothetical protein GGR52DRAFT_523663 [Hypoxylon sp. FL1284]